MKSGQIIARLLPAFLHSLGQKQTGLFTLNAVQKDAFVQPSGCTGVKVRLARFAACSEWRQRRQRRQSAELWMPIGDRAATGGDSVCVAVV